MVFAMMSLAMIMVCPASYADEIPCPQYDTPACIDFIRSQVDMVSYAVAVDAADLQCFGEASGLGEDLDEQGFLLRVSGCHSLSRLHTLMGRHERAFEA